MGPEVLVDEGEEDDDGTAHIIHILQYNISCGMATTGYDAMSTGGLVKSQKKDKDRRKGKGCRFCLGGRIYSMPCCASCLLRTILNNRMNCTRMI